jgi:hypothetical protein
MPPSLHSERIPDRYCRPSNSAMPGLLLSSLRAVGRPDGGRRQNQYRPAACEMPVDDPDAQAILKSLVRQLINLFRDVKNSVSADHG